MTDEALSTSTRRNLPRAPLAPLRWHPSRRDKLEGILAYSLLGAVACGMVYIFCVIAAKYSA
ncbi:MAG: hypothetical protein ABI552_08795 [Casimicrobiaceae bacterium]